MKPLDKDIQKLKISTEASAAITELKNTPFWPALKELMNVYIQQQKDIAWKLEETDEKFAVRHAQYSSRANAFNFLIKFVEKDVRRESDA